MTKSGERRAVDAGELGTPTRFEVQYDSGWSVLFEGADAAEHVRAVDAACFIAGDRVRWPTALPFVRRIEEPIRIACLTCGGDGVSLTGTPCRDCTHARTTPPVDVSDERRKEWRAMAAIPESLNVGELNAAVRYLREALYRQKLRTQEAESQLSIPVRQESEPQPCAKCGGSGAVANSDSASGYSPCRCVCAPWKTACERHGTHPTAVADDRYEGSK